MVNKDDDYFLSKISMDNREEDNDNVIYSILNKDDDTSSKP